MKVISGGRGTGKTRKMMDWLIENEQAILVVANEERRRDLINRYDFQGEYGIAVRIQTAQLRMNRPASFYTTDVAIDDVDDILRSLFGRVQMFSMRYEGGDDG